MRSHLSLSLCLLSPIHLQACWPPLCPSIACFSRNLRRYIWFALTAHTQCDTEHTDKNVNIRILPNIDNVAVFWNMLLS